MRAYMIACAAVVFTLQPILGQTSREILETVPLTASGRVFIDTYKGSLEIATWDRSEVEIRARIEAEDSYDRRDAEGRVRDTEIRIDASVDQVRVKSDYRNVKDRGWDFFDLIFGSSGSLPSVHYTIRMPKGASLKVKDYKSEGRVTGVSGQLIYDTYKGSLDVDKLDGSADVETYKGEARVHYMRLSGPNRYETYKGEIEIVLPRGQGFELEANVGRRGDLRTDYVLEKKTSGKRKSGRYHSEVNGGGPVMRIETYKGTFRLKEG